MTKFSGSFCVLVLVASAASAQSFGGPLPAPLAIPDGSGPNPCQFGTPVSHIIPVSGIGNACGGVRLTLDIAHTWYGDVELVLTNPANVSVTLMGSACAGYGPSAALASGTAYTLSDSGTDTFDNAATNAANLGLPVPAGSYTPDAALSAFLGSLADGNWTLTFRDQSSSFIGTVFGATLQFGAGGGTSYSLSQCGGPGSPLLVAHLNGIPGHEFLAPALLGPAASNPGGTPNGWFFGLNISINNLILEAQLGPPFHGFLDGAGGYSLTIPGVPAGIDISTVGIHVDPVTGAISYSSGAFTYTTI